jgi:hypothetical protein
MLVCYLTIFALANTSFPSARPAGRPHTIDVTFPTRVLDPAGDARTVGGAGSVAWLLCGVGWRGASYSSVGSYFGREARS